MKWHTLEEERLLERLHVDPSRGLSDAEARKRLLSYGPNELKVEERPSPFTIFLRQFKDILIIILLIATLLSALLGEIFDALFIFLIVVFSAGLGFLQEYRAEKALEALKRMLAPTVTVLRDGKEVEVDTVRIVPGDILILEAGDRVPADARVIESRSMMVDEASLTGESLPVEKSPGTLKEDTPLPERRNMLYAGTVVTYGRGKGVVVATGMESELGRIAREVGAIPQEKTPLERRTEEIGRWLGAIALTVSIGVAVVGIGKEMMAGDLTPEFVLTIIMFAVALAVAAVPEALAAIVTGTLAIGMREMARSNALIRRMPAVETLGSVTVVCSDKTGTITRGEMTVRKVYAMGGFFTISGAGYQPEGAFEPEYGKERLVPLLEASILCNDADLRHEEGRWSIKGDPTEGALVVLAQKAGVNVREVRLKSPRVGEIPFSSERKLMTTMHERDGIKEAYMKGAPEVVLERCNREWKRVERLSMERKGEILKIAEDMAREGLRVLAVARRRIEEGQGEVEREMEFLGLVGMMDPPREEAIEAVRVCRRIGIRPVMITGDHKLTAMAVAREVGILQEGDLVLTGKELEALPDEEFEGMVERVSVYARVSPMDKLKIVRAWKGKGHIVAMTGDGVNDAPALKNADIGVAMGITGTEVTKEAADMVLTDDNFATILKAIEKGRWIYDNIKKYLTYLLRCNITEVAVIGGVVLIMGPEYLPLLPAAILYINLATDGLPALALGVSPPDPDIMERPPRDPREGVFSRDVKILIFGALFIEIPFFYYLFFQELSDLTHARTEMFFLFIFTEVLIAMNFRSFRFSIFKVPPHRWLTLAVLWELLLVGILVQFPSVREAFGIVKPGMRDLAIILGFGLFISASMEVLKAYILPRLHTLPKSSSSLSMSSSPK